jgi:hypothetical protein
MKTERPHVEIDIPCDVRQLDESGYGWAFLDEARDPALIGEGAIVTASDKIEPVLARVVDVQSASSGRRVVHLEILPGDPADYVAALRRARLLTA